MLKGSSSSIVMISLMLWILVMYICIGPTMPEQTCCPTISDGKEGKPEIGGFISIECGISTCNTITKLVFEKTDPNGTWVPIFERVNRTYHRALATATGYTLDNRDDYYGFRTQHTLHIMPLILQDQGKWRCIVYNAKHEEYKSGPLDFNIYVPPAEENFYIRPNNSDLVMNQPQNFTCLADGVHPEPIVIWEANGVEYMGNDTRQQREDQLWIVISTLQIVFNTTGVKKLNCIMKTKTRNSWLEDHINITVQEPATVLYPLHELSSTVNVDSSFSQRCIGSGFKPHITWKRNDEIIFANDTRYIIQEECDDSKCDSFLTSKSIDPEIACVNNEPYSGVYTCVVALEPPYQSSDASHDMNIHISKVHCKESNIGRKVGFSMLLVVFAVLIAFLIWYLVYRKRRKRDFAFYNSMTLQETLELNYTPEARIIMCSQKRVDDQIVLFEYGTHRVFIHGVNNLTQHTEYTCDVKIHDMIRISNDSFVATSTRTYFTHFLRVENLNVRSLDNIPRKTEIMKVLICAETDNSFIKCGISRCSPHDDGHTDGEMGDREDLASGYERYTISIFRVRINMMKPKFTPIHIRTVPMTKEPIYIAVTPDKRRIIMVTSNGKLYVVPLEKTNTDLIKLKCKKDADRSVRSLFINNHDVILGDFVGKILVYTRDLHNLVVQNLEKPINGITVHGRRMIVCCGHEGQQQSIKVFSPKHRVEGTSLTEMSRMDHITKSHEDHM